MLVLWDKDVYGDTYLWPYEVSNPFFVSKNSVVFRLLSFTN